MLLRKGLGNDLGYLRKSSDARDRRPKLYELSGVPRAWQSEEINELLKGQNWNQIEVLSKKRQGKIFVWVVKAQPPETTSAQGVWTYECDDLFRIIINESVARGPAPISVAAVKAPKKTWRSQGQAVG